MDWGKDYFTFSDTNIEYVWRMLKTVHERDWLYLGHRSTEWCPRCGTSISQHELIGSYVDRADPSLFVRFPLLERPGEFLVDLDDDAVDAAGERRRRRQSGRGVRPPRERRVGRGRALSRREARGEAPGRGARRLDVPRPVRRPRPARVEHRVIPWDDVSMDDGTGIVHIAPGCGTEDFELSQVHGLAVVQPVDESGRFYDSFGWLHGLSTTEAAEQIIGNLEEKGVLVEAGLHEHRYPECWRCHTPLIFRIADDWFISVRDLRQQMLDANATVEWTPEYMGKRMDDWLRNMGDWNISRRRYYGLPLPFYPVRVRASERDRVARGARGARRLRARAARGAAPAVDRPRARALRGVRRAGRADQGGRRRLARRRHRPVLDARLAERRAGRAGLRDRRGRGADDGRPPRPRVLGEVVPGGLGQRDARADPALVLLAALHVGRADGKAPFRRVLGYEKMLDETGREMHASWGNTIAAEDAFDADGRRRDALAVLRAAARPEPPVRLRPGGRGQAQAPHLLELGQVLRRLREHRRLRAVVGGVEPEGAAEPLDRWLVERTHAFVADATAGYERWLDRRRDARLRGVSRRSLELVHPPLAAPLLGRGRRLALQTLWYALVQTLRVLAPILPFVTDHLWRTLVLDGPESVHLAGWPEVAEPDRALLDEIAAVRRVVELGRQARSSSGIKLRQPLRRLVVEGASVDGHLDEIADELRVKSVELRAVEAVELRVKPNLPTLGPKLGKELGAIRDALAAGEFEELPGGRFRVAGHELEPDEVLVERGGREGWAVASGDGVTVALDLSLDDELLLEGDAYELIHRVNTLRKEQGLELTDRIVLTVPEEMRGLIEAHGEWVKREVLAVDVNLGDELKLEKS